MNPEATQTLLEQFAQLGRDLIIKHGQSKHDLHRIITNELIRASIDLPPIKILYGATYGGYSFCEAFENYVDLSNAENRVCMYDKDSRVKLVPMVMEFGKFILDSLPYLKGILYIYKHENVEDLVRMLTVVTNCEHKKQILVNNREKITHLATYGVDTWCGTTIELINYVSSRGAVFDGFTEKTMGMLIRCIDNVIEECNKELKALRDEAKHKWPTGGDVIGRCRHAYERASRPSTHKMAPMCFLSALDKYGNADDRVWIHQHSYNQRTMRFLQLLMDNTVFSDMLQNPITGEAIDLDTLELEDDDIMTFALMCVSDIDSQIKIKTVPAWSQWRVDDYNGMENVVLM